MRRLRRRSKKERKLRRYLRLKAYEDKLAAGMEKAFREPKPSGLIPFDFETVYGGQGIRKTPLQKMIAGTFIHDEMLVTGTIDYAALECRILARTYALADTYSKRPDESSKEKALCQEIPRLVLEEWQACCRYGASPCRTTAGAGEALKLRRARWYGTIPLSRLAQEQLRAARPAGGLGGESEKVWGFIQKCTAAALKNNL